MRIAVADANVEVINRMEQEAEAAPRNTRVQRASAMVAATVPTVTRSNRTDKIKPPVGTQEAAEAAFKEAALTGEAETVPRHVRPVLTEIFKEAGCLVPDRICFLLSEHYAA